MEAENVFIYTSYEAWCTEAFEFADLGFNLLQKELQ